MRAIVVTLLLIVGSAVGGAAQQPPTTTSPSQASDPAPGLPEPHVLSRAVGFASHWLGGGDSSPKDGFYPDFGDMITGAGWISVGPGYRRHFLDRHLSIDGSAAISSRAYKDAQARIELNDLAGNHATLGFQAQWQDLTQVNYFASRGLCRSRRIEYRSGIPTFGVRTVARTLASSATFGW